MRVMVLVKANEDSEAGQLPPAELFEEMNRFNQQLVEAGVMLAADGLHPSSRGKRVAFDTDGGTTVIDGPFPETNELIAGFWIWQVSSLDEAVQWLSRSPFRGTTIEIRQVFDTADFGDALPESVRQSEQQMREKLAQR
jgi:hypothetical protein